MADALFHDSTIAALKFYANENGWSDWFDTTEFLQQIRLWWDMANVKNPSIGIRKRQESKKAVTISKLDTIIFMDEFLLWLKAWEEMNKDEKAKQKKSLTPHTMLAIQQTTRALADVASDLLENHNFEFVLLGLLQSDPIEKRFGWYRQLSGANFFVSVKQILEAEKSIRLRSLVKFSGCSMVEVACLETEAKIEDEKDVLENVEELGGVHNPDSEDPANIEDKNVLFYIAGYYARSLAKKSCM